MGDIHKAKYCKAIYLFIPKSLQYCIFITESVRVLMPSHSTCKTSHSTCKTSWGGIFIKEILYKFFRPHETKGLSSLVFLPKNFRKFFFFIRETLYKFNVLSSSTFRRS